MGILSWLVIGLIAGWLAGAVMKGSGYGLIGDIVIGIVGALIAGLLATPLFGVADPVNGINIGSIVAAFLGAVVLILILRLVSGRSRV
jgi:uncharacterized membrane protein YeaQ/YmgE (transglycosylase-associated protein family)